MGAMTRVVLIVSGGIAAYKAPDLVRKLIAVGCEVQVVTTAAASAFCTELSLATVSARPVRHSLLDAAEEGRVGHIEIADWAELVLVAPATADLMARAAAGLANDLATTILLATEAPVLWAPAMNTNMWRHPATRANLERLRERKAVFVGPDRGELACGWIGEGRMIDPPVIAAAARAVADRKAHPEVWPPVRGADWRGRKLLVTAGPTRAYLDPVRFISNASTGLMGFCLAEAAAARGAEVVLVAGPVGLDTPRGVRRIDVETGAQMLDACGRELGSGEVDLVAMVAAVADLIPAEPATRKVGKEQVLDAFASMRWEAEVDILATLTARCHASPEAKTRFLGFAAQTVDEAEAPRAEDVETELRRLGAAKLERKGCDALFVNRVGVPGLGFGSSTNAGLLMFADAETLDAGEPRPKQTLAHWLLDQLAARWWSDEVRS
ncbi:Coenzyme A biosynthesis bifunctional protein CoaBC [Enhygromyxa salina]|uniref:Coenzyme A biosynthesis bifunctional protein CoaBC n=1 Tax=Enhygromyxa salina TaxID=215803 RepID=A0A2S9XCH7_9BACT|nr:bifunctional phosphopantothenoylcysteine decarboxylase/phosphopantothenate--cysteine ligase CoaBC [Enhygromyxa salina]PRP90558.1 Coenzyme A biosynthesis bifunctional protein CoaBC [Enhygromyxa salina]